MKNTIAIALLACALGACASNPSSGGNEVAEASDGSTIETKRVCERIRTNETGQRIKRVCRDVPVEGS